MSTKGTALITGASTGIGAVYADRLARRGFDLILVARNLDRLKEVAAKLASTGVKIDTLQADLTDKAGLAKVEKRLAEDKTITQLINNAGMAVAGNMLDGDIDKYEQMIVLNIIAPTRLAKAAAVAFAARKAGTIINVGSVTAFIPERFNGVYSGSKAYILNLTQALSVELAPHGVTVQAVLPGATRTEIWERAGHDINALPPEMVMEVDEMVDAALKGFDLGELVTIPSLPDIALWDAMQAARHALGPNLSLNHAAARYKA
jgi:short-subunit dehydrogenase